jgi:hypothetical protein
VCARSAQGTASLVDPDRDLLGDDLSAGARRDQHLELFVRGRELEPIDSRWSSALNAAILFFPSRNGWFETNECRRVAAFSASDGQRSSPSKVD